jgi:nucleoside-diphosphate-sugar epimerase
MRMEEKGGYADGMRALYIGGTGEISLACVEASVRAGQEVWVFNRGTSEEALPEGVERISGELNNSTYRELGGRGFDVVCQFVAYDLAQVERDLEVFGGRCGQYVFISTASAYQKPPPLNGWRITEDRPLSNPFWPYSQAKADAEAWLFARHAEGKLPVTVVRPSHTYRRRFPGTFVSGDDHVWRLTTGRPVVVHGDGTGLWTLTHASDFAKAFVRLLGNPRALGEAFHITRPDAFTWNDIYATIARAVGVDRPRFVYVPTASLVRYRREWAGPLLGDKAWPVQFDPTKLQSVVGEFKCTVGFEEGMASVVPHWRKRSDRFVPDEALHRLIDRIAAEQETLGSAS